MWVAQSLPTLTSCRSVRDTNIMKCPFSMTWQELKDFVRATCGVEAERVEVLQRMCAWVCVKGKENFHKAMSQFKETTLTTCLKSCLLTRGPRRTGWSSRWRQSPTCLGSQ